MMGQLAHLANYARLRDEGICDIAGVTDLKQKLAAAVVQHYWLPRVYATLEELLSDHTVDGVVCVQQWPNNYQLVRQILEAGKSVMTEKPMVGRLDEAEELTALAQKQGVLYAIGHMKRYDTGVELAKSLVDELRTSQEVGPLLTINALCSGDDWLHAIEAPIRVDDSTPLPPLQPAYPDGCDTAEKRRAYDYLVNVFSHNVNLCHYFLEEEMEPQYAQFLGDRAIQSVLRSGRILITIQGTSIPNYEWREETILTFERGEMIIKTPTPMNRQATTRISFTRPGKNGFMTTQYHPPVEWAFYRQARGFIDALAGRASLRNPAQLVVSDVRVMQRIIEIAEVL